MILDKYISFQTKVVFAVICSGVWIFFRTSECYTLIPRMHWFPVVFVMLWTYLNYYDPLFLPIGLLLLVAFPMIRHRFEEPQIHDCPVEVRDQDHV